MRKHTPKPWKIIETVNPAMIPDYHIKIGEEQISIFPYKRTYSEDGTQSGLVYDGEKLANARLIAAAPDLLEALEVAVRLNSFREFNDHIPAMKAALAKAKGESNE